MSEFSSETVDAVEKYAAQLSKHLVDVDFTQDVILGMQTSDEIVLSLSEIPEEWVSQWREALGKDALIDLLDSCVTGGFYSGLLLRSTSSITHHALARSRMLTEAYCYSLVHSEANRAFACLISLAGKYPVSEWAQYDMRKALVMVNDKWETDAITRALVYGIDADLLASLDN